MDRAPPPAEVPLGKVLGDRYRLVSRIAEGGMGTVYRAEHLLLRKRVAVKVLRPELSLDEGLARRFQQEAIATSQISQENVVDVTDFGSTSEGSLYLVMEELDGASLASLLQRSGSLALERALGILAQVCRALAAAHGRGIVHRDLKPDNIVVVRREDGSELVKVVDFGISDGGAGLETSPATRAGTIIGTPEYMAPEQIAAAAIDHRADVYAFGVLAYELLTGTLPFRCGSPLATLLEHQTRSPEPPSRRRPGLPADLEALILKALAKEPRARQQSMAEVAVELTRVLAALGLPPVYERSPLSPPAAGPPGGLTDHLPGPCGPREGARCVTLALDPPPAGEVARARRPDPISPAPDPSLPLASPRGASLRLASLALAFLLGAGLLALLLSAWPAILLPGASAAALAPPAATAAQATQAPSRVAAPPHSLLQKPPAGGRARLHRGGPRPRPPRQPEQEPPSPEGAG